MVELDIKSSLGGVEGSAVGIVGFVVADCAGRSAGVTTDDGSLIAVVRPKFLFLKLIRLDAKISRLVKGDRFPGSGAGSDPDWQDVSATDASTSAASAADSSSSCILCCMAIIAALFAVAAFSVCC